MKPIIGIIGRPDKVESGNEVICVYRDVSNAIIKNGGIPIGILPLVDDFNSFNEEMYKIIDYCDGIILQGGDEFYNYDLECLKYIYKNDIPVLGICLGMQLMGYLFGGECVNINAYIHKQKQKKYVHKVYLDKSSKLYQIFKSDNISVNSRHKSAIVNTNINIVGLSDDGIIEAVEDASRTFFIGVQWHPESMISYDILENNLFNYFVDVCRK